MIMVENYDLQHISVNMTTLLKFLFSTENYKNLKIANGAIHAKLYISSAMFISYEFSWEIKYTLFEA